MSSTAFESHDHASCIAQGVASAERHCAANKLQFTRARRRVLEILLEEHRSMGAYEILDRLRAEGFGSQPPVAYRALDFLVSHGFAHRIERLNAFIACIHAENRHSPAFLICRSCDRVVEAEADPRAGELGRAAEAAGFVIERTVREAIGLCPSCATEAA
ncbi:Fur family zinc uptake transcriptional regulator [Palleronia aestuarii]|uniref:Fur family zinc uptake transcriptional regulator n=1 Tax=Palleronia aestuarii TaxID=568105 RepID=A0A2W7NAM9_9RHOB|nr:transcriptional repressor [Palleronia aestuarii]PZX17138.1 Fur family zinc uptake transcriptional regulator [Palleronia aestuarii]